ncbi:MAG: site-specific DNA-methyltransferase [Chloroflexota bacterium]|nr:site-specific DNA-methyltransferase [Chloroflexota bacterium]
MAVERAPQVRRFAPPANGAKRGVRLEWEGKKAEIDVPVLPFQTIETINEPRQQLTLFSAPDDARPAFPPGWKNKLIWGDNKLAMAALAEQYAGQVDLIYIDPPFDTGADFSVQVEVGDESVTKEPSIIERHAYQDTWGQGLDSYVQMMYERLMLMHTLLSEDGSIYVHCDPRVNSALRMVLDEVFSSQSFRNEITWKRQSAHNDSSRYGAVHDTIWFYSKSTAWTWNEVLGEPGPDYIEGFFDQVELATGRRYARGDLSAGGLSGGGYDYDYKGIRRIWRCPLSTMEQYDREGRLHWPKNGVPRLKRYLDEFRGVPLQDIWTDIKVIHNQSQERVGYATQKPETLLERILSASSRPGDLVLDCFAGSGTTAVVAERFGRRWIACDVGRFAIHTTRKRLLGIQGPNSERCRAFEILNLGHYEQQFWQGIEGDGKDEITAKKRAQDYIRAMLTFYHAHPLDGAGRIHGEKGDRAVHVGPLAESVSRVEAFEASEAALTLGFRRLDILGWEWDFESNETVKEDAKMRGVDLRLIQIPKEMLDGRARKLFEAGTLTFPELASLQIAVEPLLGQRRSYHVHLEDFIVPPDTLPDALRDRVMRWQDYIDYWSVDWEFGKETLPGERDTFHNMWQDFRTKKKRALALTSEAHDYAAPGMYTVVVKVVDIFGNDTTVSRKVEVP